jgi:hypothetical protein
MNIAVTNCIFEGAPPAGFASWEDFFRNCAATGKVSGLAICSPELYEKKVALIDRYLTHDRNCDSWGCSDDGCSCGLDEALESFYDR